jgi:hypothetical protein
MISRGVVAVSFFRGLRCRVSLRVLFGADIP